MSNTIAVTERGSRVVAKVFPSALKACSRAETLSGVQLERLARAAIRSFETGQRVAVGVS